MSSGAGWDARGDWFDPILDQAWLDENWPVTRSEGCECYDPRTMSFGPSYPCGWCLKNDKSSEGAA